MKIIMKCFEYIAIIIFGVIGFIIGYYIVAGFFMSIISLCTFSNLFLKEIFYPFTSSELLHIHLIRLISYIGAVFGFIVGTSICIGIIED